MEHHFFFFFCFSAVIGRELGLLQEPMVLSLALLG